MILLSSFLIRLSGESPFQGNNDVETLALVTAAQWEFDEESFEEITKEAKDFISSLLIKDTRYFHTHVTRPPDAILSTHVTVTAVFSQAEDVLWRGARPSLDGSVWLWRAGDQESVQGKDEEVSCQTEVEGDAAKHFTFQFAVLFFFWSVAAAIVFKQKAGKALLALKRMTLLSKGESTASAHIPEEGKTHIEEHTPSWMNVQHRCAV